MTRVERFETVVVGAGQSGLAVGYHLAARDVDFVILGDEKRVGDNWRKRWDSLRLFTPARYSGLPGMPFPAMPSHRADKDEVADYLERYAERNDLPLRLDTRAAGLTWNGERFDIATDRPAALIANATLPDQRVARGQLGEIAALARSEGIESPATLVVGEVVDAVPLRQLAPGWVPAAKVQSSGVAAGR